MKPIYFGINKEDAVEVLPENYALMFSDGFVIGMSTLDKSWSLFGDSFMRGNYIIHDPDNKRMGFNVVKEKAKFNPTLLIILLCTLVPACVCCTICCVVICVV